MRARAEALVASVLQVKAYYLHVNEPDADRV